MNVAEALIKAKEIYDSTLSDATLTDYLDQLDGMVQTKVFRRPLKKVCYLDFTGTGISFPDDRTMVLPSVPIPAFPTGGELYITGLSDYAENNAADTVRPVYLKVLAASNDGLIYTFAKGTFKNTGSDGDEGEATVSCRCAENNIMKHILSSVSKMKGVYFPDDATMCCPSAPTAYAGGTVTLEDLSDYSANNIVVRILEISPDGKTLYFASGTFTDTGDAGETAEATITYSGAGAELSAPPQYAMIYPCYTAAMAAFTDGEFNVYNNLIIQYNQLWSDFNGWYARNYLDKGKCL